MLVSMNGCGWPNANTQTAAAVAGPMPGSLRSSAADAGTSAPVLAITILAARCRATAPAGCSPGPPDGEDVGDAAAAESELHGGERRKELPVLCEHPSDLGLLEHDFRDEDLVGVVGAAPGQVAPVALEVVPYRRDERLPLAPAAEPKLMAGRDHCFGLASAPGMSCTPDEGGGSDQRHRSSSTVRSRAGPASRWPPPFLSDRGYRVLAKNQRTPLGEFDLVCRTRVAGRGRRGQGPLGRRVRLGSGGHRSAEGPAG